MSKAKIKKLYRGLSTHRYSSDPLELEFATGWQKENEHAGRSRPTLAYLMDRANRGDIALSDRDWLVANTVIQWLGSPVGQTLLVDVLSTPAALVFRAEALLPMVVADFESLSKKKQADVIRVLHIVKSSLEACKEKVDADPAK